MVSIRNSFKDGDTDSPSKRTERGHRGDEAYGSPIAAFAGDEEDAQTKDRTKDKGPIFLRIKGLAHPDDTTVLNKYAPHNRHWKCIKHSLTD